jgi:hypothetical protein
MVDGRLTWRRNGLEVRLQGFNLLDANAHASGYTDGTARYFYPIAERNALVTIRREF